MARLPWIWILLFFATCLFSNSLAAVELQKLPAVGKSFSGRIELKEVQEFIEHWSRQPRFSRRFTLTAEITWTVRQVKKNSVVLEGRVITSMRWRPLSNWKRSMA